MVSPAQSDLSRPVGDKHGRLGRLWVARKRRYLSNRGGMTPGLMLGDGHTPEIRRLPVETLPSDRIARHSDNRQVVLVGPICGVPQGAFPLLYAAVAESQHGVTLVVVECEAMDRAMRHCNPGLPNRRRRR